MTEHRHEWKLTAERWFGTFRCRECGEYLPYEKIERMLGELASLRAENKDLKNGLAGIADTMEEMMPTEFATTIGNIRAYLAQLSKESKP